MPKNRRKPKTLIKVVKYAINIQFNARIYKIRKNEKIGKKKFL